MSLKFPKISPKSIHDPRQSGWQKKAREADIIINIDKESGYFRATENGDEDNAVVLPPHECLESIKARAKRLIEEGMTVAVIPEKNVFDAHDGRISVNKSNPLTPEKSIAFRDELQAAGVIVASIDELIVARVRTKDYSWLSAKLKEVSAKDFGEEGAYKEKARITAEKLNLKAEAVEKACRTSKKNVFNLKGLDCYFMYKACRSSRTQLCTVTPRLYDEGGPEMDLAWKIASGLYNRMQISSLKEPNLEHSKTAITIEQGVRADLAELSLGGTSLASGYRVTMQDTNACTVAEAALRAAGYCDLRIYELLVCAQVVDGEGLLLVNGRHPDEKLMLQRILWRRQGSGKDEAGYANSIFDKFSRDRTSKAAGFTGGAHRAKEWNRPDDEKEAAEYDAWNASYDIHSRAVKLMFQVVRWHLWKHYEYVK